MAGGADFYNHFGKNALEFFGETRIKLVADGVGGVFGFVLPSLTDTGGDLD